MTTKFLLESWVNDIRVTKSSRLIGTQTESRMNHWQIRHHLRPLTKYQRQSAPIVISRFILTSKFPLKALYEFKQQTTDICFVGTFQGTIFLLTPLNIEGTSTCPNRIHAINKDKRPL